MDNGLGQLGGREPTRVVVITCAVLETEVEHFVRSCPQVLHVEKLRQGLHNDPPRLRRELQEAVDRVEQQVPKAEVIVLGYGLCSRGTEEVCTRRCRMVIPRAHDCITLLLGDRRRYADYVRQQPGTYWYSPGWNRHHVPPGPQRYETLHKQYVERYGEDNAEYLMSAEQHWFNTYNRATYVDLGVGATPEDLTFTRACADWLHWQMDHQHGDAELLRTLLTGPWDDERFLVLAPGQSLTMTADPDRIIRAVQRAPAPACNGCAATACGGKATAEIVPPPTPIRSGAGDIAGYGCPSATGEPAVTSSSPSQQRPIDAAVTPAPGENPP